MKGYFEEIVLAENELATNELERANKDWPAFHSRHEAYGVMLEELEESTDELENAKIVLEYFWRGVKEDYTDTDAIEILKTRALNCAAECVQLAAMAQKTIDSLGE